MATASDHDRFASERARRRFDRVSLILRLASCEHPRQILEYGLDHHDFELTSMLAEFHLTPNKLYPTMRRMIQLGVVDKFFPRHQVVTYELTSEGRLVAECLRKLTAGSPRESLEFEEE